MINIADYFISLATAVPLVVLITGWLNTHLLKNASSTIHQVVSWGVALLVSVLGAWKDLGVFADLNVLWTVIYAAALGLASNGFFDIKLIQSILSFLGAAKKPVTT